MFLGANRIVLMRLTDEKKTKTSISQKEIIFKGVQRKKFFLEQFRKTKISQFVCLAYLFLYFPMKIEHIIYVLARRIINFHLFLQKICDLELWTQFPMKTPHQKFQLWTPSHISGSRMNFEPKSILGVPWHVGSLEKPTVSWPKRPPCRKIHQIRVLFWWTWNGSSGPGPGPLKQYPPLVNFSARGTVGP